MFRGLKNSKSPSSSDWKSPLRSKRHLGGRKFANCPRAVGVDIALFGVLNTARDVLDTDDEVLEDDVVSDHVWIPGFIASSSANLFVVAQNKKLPRIEPCGDPPGTVFGTDILVPTLTDISLPYKKAATQSILIWVAPRSFRA